MSVTLNIFLIISTDLATGGASDCMLTGRPHAIVLVLAHQRRSQRAD
jgi:hypothetical protein